MRRCFAAVLPALLAVTVLSAATTVRAQSEQERAREGMEEGAILDYAEIRAIAIRTVPGRVVGQALDRMHSGRSVYRIRVLQATGRVVEVVIDAGSGRVLNVKGRG